jgi:hypothetical protein
MAKKRHIAAACEIGPNTAVPGRWSRHLVSNPEVIEEKLADLVVSASLIWRSICYVG